jgi:hypothetical protein
MFNHTIHNYNNHGYYYNYDVIPYNYNTVSYYQVICIIWFLIYNILGYNDIDITFIIQDRHVLKLMYLFFLIISIICLTEIFLFKTMI